MMPAVGSVWRNGDEEIHVLHRTEIDVSFVWVQKDNSGWQGGCWKTSDWHRWAADAVQVWPETPQHGWRAVVERLGEAVESVLQVQPTYNGYPSCPFCGEYRGGHADDCDGVAVLEIADKALSPASGDAESSQPQTPQPVGETVRVRAVAVVTVNHRGHVIEWDIKRSCEGDEHDDIDDLCSNGLTYRKFAVFVDIPLPAVPTITASVEPTE